MERILETFNRHEVEYLLIGGVNFLLRHEPVLTFDVDVWIRDEPTNRQRCEQALVDLDAAWGRDDADWRPTRDRESGWLELQAVFSLTTAAGALDVFRAVRGLSSWETCRARADRRTTPGGTPYWSLSDRDMLACQLALDETQRKQDRIRALRLALGEES